MAVVEPCQEIKHRGWRIDYFLLNNRYEFGFKCSYRTSGGLEIQTTPGNHRPEFIAL